MHVASVPSIWSERSTQFGARVNPHVVITQGYVLHHIYIVPGWRGGATTKR